MVQGIGGACDMWRLNVPPPLLTICEHTNTQYYRGGKSVGRYTLLYHSNDLAHEGNIKSVCTGVLGEVEGEKRMEDQTE